MTESLTGTAMPENDAADEAARVRRDRARLKTVGFQHGGVMIAALVIWGSAAQWLGMASEWLVQLVGIGAGFFVGVVLAFLAHEWGHFSGARLSGALSPVLKERSSFFMFNFKTGARYDNIEVVFCSINKVNCITIKSLYIFMGRYLSMPNSIIKL